MAPHTDDRWEPWSSTTRRPDPLGAMTDADAAILVTEWPELTDVDRPTAARLMRNPLLLDGRNLLDPAALLSAGSTHMAVGRATRRPPGEEHGRRGLVSRHMPLVRPTTPPLDPVRVVEEVPGVREARPA
ncbi:UDP binding domain-containing protein [Streptomyces sp. HNM0645]|uniref:UDP binding domain-containing protein n=1 Tax=Streptomyces sp. HNM0645 TaxID=2782343 RepID=UPI0024B6BE30|nr:UDP binding domain-containing protein [Streptomyces sp. HNM0645]MDI9886147.1 UDP binding domain-containing protein [Streptomyces sp. HNM0645]